jgi:hypothetical protein
MLTSDIELKLDVLSSGITLDDTFLDFYASSMELIEKRRAYGTGETTVATIGKRIPPEIFLESGIICAVNSCSNSEWSLVRDNGENFLVNGSKKHRVTFPARPRCYGKVLSDGSLLEQTLTVYGNSTLGLFSPGHCYYFNDDRQCRFCSLGAARDSLSDHAMKIKANLANEAVEVAVSLEPSRYKRVLLNGGSIRDYDKGYRIQCRILKAVRDGRAGHLPRHLIAMPPENHDLFREFAEVGDKMAMSLEIFDPELFDQICPGKSQDYGREHFLKAYEVAVSILGPGRVYAGLVAGLEPLDSVIKAIEFFGSIGVVPAIAAFHPDSGSKFADVPRPTPEYLAQVLEAMAEVYGKYGFEPLIEGSGRNALDTEAYLLGAGVMA